MLFLPFRLLMAIALGVHLCSPIASWAQRARGQSPSPELASREQSLELAGVRAGQVVVIYEHPELTIKSNGASLMDVLRAVCARIGAELDAQSLSDDVVLGIAGPGGVRDVLTAMFTGSPYELSTNGAPEDPNRVARVIVLPRESEKSDSFTAAAQPINMPEADTPADLVNSAEQPSMQEALEVLKQAKAELDHATDSDAGEMSKLLDDVEAQIKSGAIKGTQSSQPVIAQRGASPPSRHHGRH